MSVKRNGVDEYIATFARDVRERLQKIRAVIRRTAPEAVESIAYGVPAYQTNGKPLVYFAGFERHIGFYATPGAHRAFTEELSKYTRGKGSVQFPLDKPLPLRLIQRMVAYRVEENEKTVAKGKRVSRKP